MKLNKLIVTSHRTSGSHRTSEKSLPADVSKIDRANALIKRGLLLLVIVACVAGFTYVATGSMYVSASRLTQTTGPKNIILLIGDGMSQSYLDAASIYAHGGSGRLFMESAPHRAAMSTYSQGGIVTDSAAAASAMATGHKVFNGVISMSAPEGGVPLETSLEHYQNRCKSTGLVGTGYINHATTAAFAAHAGSRTEIEKIADNIFTQTRPNVLLGGAAAGVTPDIASQNGYTVVTNRSQLSVLVPAKNPYVSGQFGTGHMGYEYDDAWGGASFYSAMPRLSEMARHALNLLRADPDGFFLVIEASRIDHAGHENNLKRAIYETVEFDNAVREAVTWAEGRDDTLIIVTADHETGGLSVIENKGPGEFPDVKWSTFAHTDEDVPVFAWGPGSERVSGRIDNTDIYDITTANSGEPADSCDQPSVPEDNPDLAEPQATPTETPLPTATATPTLTFTPLPTLPPTATPTPSPVPPFVMQLNNEPRAWVEPGSSITYKIQYEIGDEKLDDVSLFSRVPEGVALIPDSISTDNVERHEIETVDGIDTVKWYFGTIPARGQGEVTYQVTRLNQSRQSDSGERLFGAKAIEVTKNGPDSADPGELITYDLTVTNVSNNTLADIFVVDAVPYGVSYVSGGDAPPINDEISWWIERLAPGESRTVSYTVTASRSVMTRGYKVYNPEGLGVSSYDVISTVVNDTALPFEGDGIEIINNGVWATWYQSGQFNVGRAQPIQNPMYDFYMPLMLDD